MQRSPPSVSGEAAETSTGPDDVKLILCGGWPLGSPPPPAWRRPLGVGVLLSVGAEEEDRQRRELGMLCISSSSQKTHFNGQGAYLAQSLLVS